MCIIILQIREFGKSSTKPVRDEASRDQIMSRTDFLLSTLPTCTLTCLLQLLNTFFSWYLCRVDSKNTCEYQNPQCSSTFYKCTCSTPQWMWLPRWRMVKIYLPMQETHEIGVRHLGKDRLEYDMATHSSILSWKIPWTEELGGLQSTGLQRIRHDWATEYRKRLQWAQSTRLSAVVNQLPLDVIFPLIVRKTMQNTANEITIEQQFPWFTNFCLS